MPGGANGGSNAKYGLLASLYSFLDIAQSIIFVETKSECDDLYRRLKHDGHEVSAIHSDLSTETRDRVMLNVRVIREYLFIFSLEKVRVRYCWLQMCSVVV